MRNSERTYTISVSLPIEMIKQMDKARGDVARSRFIKNALTKVINDNKTEVIGDI
jgi:metal-responsive CopG/Arc/MetJ family transcriptional regulator